MSMYSDDYQYAHSRLAETIVRLGARPVYIYKVDQGMKVSYSALDNLEFVGTCDIDDLDLKPVPLGYCNHLKTACYLTRMPMRRDWRQGLRRGNFCSLSGCAADRIPYDAINRTIVGSYPTFPQACEAVKKLKSIAWHRHWAMDNLGNVLYKGWEVPVGRIVDGELVLESRYKHLNEALKESV